MADLGEGPLFWVKKEEMTEGKMAAMASKSRPGPPLAQGLDPPLVIMLIVLHRPSCWLNSFMI